MSVAPASRERLRVFFALVPDAATQAELGALGRALSEDLGGRAIADANIHLTLAFIGDVGRRGADRLAALCLAHRASTFTLVLDRVGAFRGGDVVWIAPTDVPPALAQLQRELSSALAALRFPVEARAFEPHVTIARRCRRLPSCERCAPVAWHVRGLSLMRSEPANGGVRYRALAQCDFAP